MPTEMKFYSLLTIYRDVHHGNGIQDIFYSDPRVLYTSVHRYEHQPGMFFSEEGAMQKTGEGAGLGKNVNVPFYFHERGYGDVDYNAIFDSLLIPISREFAPDFVIIAAGFDSAKGDPVGQFRVTPGGYGVLLQKILEVVPTQKAVLVLEGGYNPGVVAKCTEECVRVLLDPSYRPQYEKGEVLAETEKVIEEVKKQQRLYWSI
eukprot:TRINITY_DN387_c1_g2_i2.p1 TRINITY_DN387_c1_g2~~TRINITY_DN387_c1_g2_i2.p1  ORF type:complete len:204 (-),score=41.67 TRINITY_DN387_c1_g2_i2:144-755(-)